MNQELCQYPHSQLTIYTLTSTLIHDLISHPAHLNTFCLNVAVVVIETIIPCLFQVAKGPSQLSVGPIVF